MAPLKDPQRFAGKMGVGTGPVPIGRWKPQPSVNATLPVDPKAKVTGRQSIQQSLEPKARKGKK